MGRLRWTLNQRAIRERVGGWAKVLRSETETWAGRGLGLVSGQGGYGTSGDSETVEQKLDESFRDCFLLLGLPQFTNSILLRGTQ